MIAIRHQTGLGRQVHTWMWRGTSAYSSRSSSGCWTKAHSLFRGGGYSVTISTVKNPLRWWLLRHQTVFGEGPSRKVHTWRSQLKDIFKYVLHATWSLCWSDAFNTKCFTCHLLPHNPFITRGYSAMFKLDAVFVAGIFSVTRPMFMALFIIACHNSISVVLYSLIQQFRQVHT